MLSIFGRCEAGAALIRGSRMPDVKAAKDWYYSEAYQSVAQHRKQGAIYNGLIVEGVN
jgi:uncharacterized protein (DUF1330 family)